MSCFYQKWWVFSIFSLSKNNYLFWDILIDYFEFSLEASITFLYCCGWGWMDFKPADTGLALENWICSIIINSFMKYIVTAVAGEYHFNHHQCKNSSHFSYYRQGVDQTYMSLCHAICVFFEKLISYFRWTIFVKQSNYGRIIASLVHY